MAECHPGRVPLGDGGQGARRHDHPRRSALHAHQRGRRHPRADPRRQRHRVPRRPRPLHPRERALLPRVRRRTTRTPRRSSRRGLPGHRGSRRAVQRLRSRDGQVRREQLAVRGRRRRAGRRAQGGRRASSAPASRTRSAASACSTSSATRRCSIRAACSRSCSATSRATRRRWSSRSAACRSDCSCASPRRLCRNSGRERTSAFCYAVGWTQHTVGVQYIRTAAILQLLLGNIGRPGGGIMALRGHASIQGSTDIPTLYNLLPGYLPMPHRRARAGSRRRTSSNASRRQRLVERVPKYIVSLLKAWFGDAATRGERLLLRPSAAAHRRSLAHGDRRRHGRRQGRRATS